MLSFNTEMAPIVDNSSDGSINIPRVGRLLPCDRPTSKYRGVRESAVWSAGALYAHPDKPGVVRAWRCYQCKETILVVDGKSSNPTKHLRLAHKVDLQDRLSSSQVEESSSQASISEGISVQQQLFSQPSIPKQPAITSLMLRPKIKEFRRNLLAWCIQRHIPFYTVDSPEFKRMMLTANPTLEGYLPGDDALRAWADEEFVVAKDKVKQLLKQALSKIHISFDIWTSQYQSYAFLGVVAHFVWRRDGKLRTESVMLGLKRLRESHTGEYVAKILGDLILEYEVDPSKLGVFMADNGSENDPAVDAVLTRFLPNLKDHSGRRGRCLAHIINLAAKDFLYGQNSEVFEGEVRALEIDDFEVERLRAAQAIWRTQGAIGRLHNIVSYIRRSSTKKEEFRKINIDDLTVDGKWLFYYCAHCIKLKKFTIEGAQLMPYDSGIKA
jgi:hypothetical protein